MNNMDEIKQRFLDGFELIRKLEELFEKWVVIKDFPNYQVSNRARVKNIVSGKIVKQSISDGYYCVNLRRNDKQISKDTHRLVAIAFIDNPENKKNVDHINRDRLDNDIDNLRWATSKENGQNASIKINNTSGTTGVIWKKKAKKWQVQISVNGKRKSGGYFDNKNEAIAKRKAMEAEYFGEFAPK